MDVYTTEQDQIEALRRWWANNGRLLLGALLVMVLAVSGWRLWNEQRNATAEAASAEYRALLMEIEGQSDEVMQRARSIVAAYPDTPYAGLASLVLAERSLNQGDSEASAAHLQWVVQNADTDGLRRLAALRMARVLLDQGKADAALAALSGLPSDAGVEEVRGDILLAQGNASGARQAYVSAVEGYAAVPSKQPLVKMKLEDLTPGAEQK